MLTFDHLARSPRAFRSLTGFDRAGFDALFDDYQAAAAELRQQTRTTKTGTRRRRAVGGGGKHSLDARTRLLLALVWARAYPTYALLGVLFALDAGNAHRNVADVLAVLDTLSDFPFDRPDHDPGRHRLSSLAEVMDAFPDARVVIDTKEQRCRRPGGEYANQKPFYSAKKKAHTLKTQVVVRPDGRIESVGASLPGGAKHDKTVLRESGVLGRLAGGEGALMDKAYASLRAEHPDRPLVTPEPARRNHPLDEHQKAANRFIARYRIVVEHTLAQMNSYTVLRQVWRGHRASHHRVVRVVGGLVNRRIDAVPLKRYPKAA
jgi:DDE superfamily endonuclease/Helix-turn-helix of DDE superfamily endonuclease